MSLRIAEFCMKRICRSSAICSCHSLQLYCKNAHTVLIRIYFECYEIKECILMKESKKNKYLLIRIILVLLGFLFFVCIEYIILDSVFLFDVEGNRKKFIVSNVLIFLGVLTYLYFFMLRKNRR